jgi:hypothetical protein
MRFGILVLIVRLCHEILCCSDSWCTGNLELRIYRITVVKSKAVYVIQYYFTLNIIPNRYLHSSNSQSINKTLNSSTWPSRSPATP